jgi:hypothetical protein
MDKFVEITRQDKGFEKENAWFNVCRKTQTPFITIKCRSKLASIQWDYITYPSELDQSLFEICRKIAPPISALYVPYKSKDSWIGLGPGVISIGNIEISAAREIASKLFDLLSHEIQTLQLTHN